jgi:hypothetical protein
LLKEISGIVKKNLEELRDHGPKFINYITKRDHDCTKKDGYLQMNAGENRDQSRKNR